MKKDCHWNLKDVWLQCPYAFECLEWCLPFWLADLLTTKDKKNTKYALNKWQKRERILSGSD